MFDQVAFWGGVFVISLFILIQSASALVGAVERMARHFRVSSSSIGIFVTGAGASIPGLLVSLAALYYHSNEIVTATVIGTNIANILLVLGCSAVASASIALKKNTFCLDLSILATATIIFLGIALDGAVSFGESLFLVLTYMVYLAYSLLYKKVGDFEDILDGREHIKKSTAIDGVILILGGIGAVISANYVVESTMHLSSILDVGTSVIAMFVIALGLSLPNLFMTLRGAFEKKPDFAVHVVVGSFFFNMLAITGVSGLFSDLPFSEKTFFIGLPILAGTTFIFVVSGISNTLHRWEGVMYLTLYIFFVIKLFNLF